MSANRAVGALLRLLLLALCFNAVVGAWHVASHAHDDMPPALAAAAAASPDAPGDLAAGADEPAAREAHALCALCVALAQPGAQFAAPAAPNLSPRPLLRVLVRSEPAFVPSARPWTFGTRDPPARSA